MMICKVLSKLNEIKNFVLLLFCCFKSLFWILPTQMTEINGSEFAWESLAVFIDCRVKFSSFSRTVLNNEYASVCCAVSYSVFGQLALNLTVSRFDREEHSYCKVMNKIQKDQFMNKTYQMKIS